MKYILLIYLYSGHGTTLPVDAFKTIGACEKAKVKVASQLSKHKGKKRHLECVPLGEF